MAVTSSLYRNALLASVSGDAWDWLTDDIRVALLNDHTPDLTHASWSQVMADEASGTGYPAGGAALGTKTATIETIATVPTIVLDAANTVWEDSSVVATHAVIYNNSPADAADKQLLAVIDFDGAEESVNGDFTLAWDADGIIHLVPNPA